MTDIKQQAAPRFERVYCSQCGGEFGPGEHGYSHCSDHAQQQAETLKCGHHASLAVVSAETGEFLYCELCDCKSARKDAEHMEESLRAELAALKAQQQAEPVRSNADLMLLIETLQKRYSISMLGSEKSLLHFARDWDFLTTPEPRITAAQVAELKRLADELSQRTALAMKYKTEGDEHYRQKALAKAKRKRAALHAALDALKGEA